MAKEAAVCCCTGPEPAIYPNPTDPTAPKLCRDCAADFFTPDDYAASRSRARVGDVGERAKLGNWGKR